MSPSVAREALLKELCKPRLPRVLWLGAASLLLLGLLAGCSNEAAVGSFTSSAQTAPSQESIELAFDAFTDATIDVTLNIADSATLATLFNQSYPAQTTPFSSSYSLAPTPVNVTVTVAFHLLGTSAIHNGTNTTAGTTLTDAGWNFSSYRLPMFVVDDPTTPTVIADVQAVASFTTLTLASAFPAGPYYLFQTKQLKGTISRTYYGTESLSVLCKDNTLATTQFTTAF